MGPTTLEELQALGPVTPYAPPSSLGGPDPNNIGAEAPTATQAYVPQTLDELKALGPVTPYVDKVGGDVYADDAGQYTRDAARTVFNGMALNWGPRLIAAVRYAANGGKIPYAQLSDEERGQLEAFAHQNPKMALALGLTGGLVVPGGVIAKSVGGVIRGAAGAGRVAQAGRAAVALGSEGAAMGAVSGAGAAKDVESMPAEAAHGAVVGGVLAPVIGGAAAAAYPVIYKSVKATWPGMSGALRVDDRHQAVKQAAQSVFDSLPANTQQPVSQIIARHQADLRAPNIARPASISEMPFDRTQALNRTVASAPDVNTAEIIARAQPVRANQAQDTAHLVADQARLALGDRVDEALTGVRARQSTEFDRANFPAVTGSGITVNVSLPQARRMAGTPAVRSALESTLTDLRNSGTASERAGIQAILDANTQDPRRLAQVTRILGSNRTNATPVLSDNVIQKVLEKLGQAGANASGSEMVAIRDALDSFQRVYATRKLQGVRAGSSLRRSVTEGTELGAPVPNQTDAALQKSISGYNDLSGPTPGRFPQQSMQAYREGVAHTIFTNIRTGDLEGMQKSLEFMRSPQAEAHLRQIFGNAEYERMVNLLRVNHARGSAMQGYIDAATQRGHDSRQPWQDWAQLGYRSPRYSIPYVASRLFSGENARRDKMLSEILMDPNMNQRIARYADRIQTRSQPGYVMPETMRWVRGTGRGSVAYTQQETEGRNRKY